MTENVKHVEVLREAVEALKRTHDGFSHDYIKDEKRCDRCKLLKNADAAIAALQREAAGGGEEFEAWFAKQDSRTEWRELVRLAYTAPRPTGTGYTRKEKLTPDWARAYQSEGQTFVPMVPAALTTPASAEPGEASKPACQFCLGDGYLHDADMICNRCNGTGIEPCA